MSADSYCGPKSSVALCTCLRTAIVSAVRNQALLCADVCGLLLFQRSDIERCSVRMPADCYCFSCPTSSVALCRCLRTAIVSAVRTRALLCADVCGLLLFQQPEVERCSMQMSADCYCFSRPTLSVALCRRLRTAIVSAIQSRALLSADVCGLLLFQRSRALLCADVCGLLLFQRSDVERCSVQMSADCYCFSGPNSSVALCRCLRTAIVSAVRGRALLCADVCGLLLFQRSEVERCFVQMSADCYCFSGPKSSVALCRCLRTAIVSAVRGRALLCADVCGLLLFQRSDVERCSVQMSAACSRSSGLMLNPHRSKFLPAAIVSAVATTSSLQSSTSSGGRVVRR